MLLFSHSVVSLCDPMDCSTPAFPVLHYLPGFAQTHVHWVSDTIQPSHPLLPPFPPALSVSQHRGLFQGVQFSSLQSLSRVRLLATPWITAHQTALSITNSRSLLRLTSIESVMPSSHLILCRPLLLLPPTLPASESFPMSQLFTWGGQSTGVSALASFLPKKSQGWSPYCPRDSQEFSPAPQFKSIY